MRRSLLISGIVLGALLTLGSLWSMVGTVMGMKGAFRSLGSSGISDPQALSHQVSGILAFTWLGLAACPIGAVLLIVCIVQLTKTHKNPPPNSAPAQAAPPPHLPS